MDRRAWFILACAVLLPWHLYQVAKHPQFFRPPLPIGDGPDYDTIGYSLSTGRGFAFAWDDSKWKQPYLNDLLADEYPHLQRDARAGTTTSRPPLVPLVLAGIYSAFGHNATSFAIFRCFSAFAIAIAGSLAVAIAFDIGSRIVVDRWTAHLAAITSLFFALFDSTIRTYAIDFLSEPLALLWTTLFLWTALNLETDRRRISTSNVVEGHYDRALNRNSPEAASNLIANHLPSRFPTMERRLMSFTKNIVLAAWMAAMVATRSMFIFWIPGIALIMLLSLNFAPRRSVLVFLTCFAVLLSPWWIRNCRKLDAFMPMGAQGAASMLGGYSDEALADQGNWHPDAQNRLERQLLSDPSASAWSNLEFERKLAHAASMETRQWIHQHFRDLPTLVGLRLKTHWGPYFGKSLVWRFGMLLGLIALFYHRRSEAYWLIGLPIISSLTVMCLYETGGRFLVPLYGLLYALAGIGFAQVPATILHVVIPSRRTS